MALALLGVCPATARAEPSRPEPESSQVVPDGIHVLDGSCYLNVGELHVNITNHGLIGSQYSSFLPYSSAPSAQWPGGSGNEYLWGGGLWVGGRIRGEISVSTGQYDREFRPGPKLIDTLYEGKADIVQRPSLGDRETGRRLPDPMGDDDGDLVYDEDMLNGVDDDGDGRVDEDWGQIGDQMFTCTMYDNLPLCRELYPAHRPLGLKVVQRAAAWGDDPYRNMVALDYEITNVGLDTIEDAYLGFYMDCDIQARGRGATQPDDLAGSWSGYIRGDDNFFHKVDVGYMRDNDPAEPLPGWFGVVMVYHSREFYGHHAPPTSEMTGFNIFATNAAVNQHGEPVSDIGRYEVMARRRRDPNQREDLSGDLKILISSGPFPSIEPGWTTHYRLALVVGAGQADMLAAAVRATQLGGGTFFNADRTFHSGQEGRETRVCLGDIPSTHGEDPIYSYKIDGADPTCVGTEPIFGVDLVKPDDFRTGPDGRRCVYVNADNCEECARLFGRECTPENGYWLYFYNAISPLRYPRYFTGVDSREARFAWTQHREYPPETPRIRVMPGDHSVEVFWDDISEITPDPNSGEIDFESYGVWRVQDWIRPEGLDEASRPPFRKWGRLALYDVVSEIPAGAVENNKPIPIGLNTGLEEAIYRPACRRDPQFAGLAEAMQAVVDTDSTGAWASRPDVRLPNGAVRPGMEGLVPWEMRPDVLDTFFAFTRRKPSPGVVYKRPTRYYHYRDPSPPNGFPLYYSVVASDHLLVWDNLAWSYYIGGDGISGNPGTNMVQTMPRPEPQTLEERRRDGQNIYVYPNPATREALAEFQQQHPTRNDATGVRVMFTNLPDTRNTIRIFTAAGDHIIDLDHNPDLLGGSISWNLMSRNGQEVTSGIYFYVVESADPAFDDFQGRFVVIR